MILSADQGNGLINPKFRWPNKEIPYEFAPIFDEAQRKSIMRSLAAIENNTCIKLRLRNKNDKDYVYITGKNKGCNSAVGRRGGKQLLNLQPNKPNVGCLSRGAVLHEFVHALGFHHQHCASNRDDYVKIMWDNILPGFKMKFKKSNNSASFGLGYDYHSITHYHAYDFSKNRQKTIVALDKKIVVGSKNRLTATDIKKLKIMYECENY